MAREKKEMIKGTYSLARNVVEQLDTYSTETGIPKTVIIEKALIAYFAKQKNDKPEK